MTIQNLKRSMCTKARSNCHIIQMGERIIDLFKNWENQNLISGKNYDKSFSLVYNQGDLIGLERFHSIFSTIRTPNYNLAKN